MAQLICIFFLLLINTYAISNWFLNSDFFTWKYIKKVNDHKPSFHMFTQSQGLNFICPLEFLCWNPSPLYIRMWPYLGNRVIVAVSS